MTNRKLIITDLDGTLLNNKSELSKTTINAVKKLVKAGHIFCISTGRPLRSAIKFQNQLGLDTLISTLNGGVISKPSDPDFTSISFSFSSEVLMQILLNEDVKKYTNYVVVENPNCTYFICKQMKVKMTEGLLNRFHIDKDSLIYIKDVKNINLRDPLLNPISILISLNKDHVDKVSFSIKSLLDTFIIRMWNDIDDQKNVIIEINTLFSTKRTAMKYMSCYYGISLKDTYAFGDNENDIEMLQSLPHAFAMKNAIPNLKLISYKITKFNNDKDGVVKELLNELKP
ncbi:MAG: HAD family hydrolase [Mycoplasmoidaceae bacterium]